METETTVALVTGGTSGIGLETAKALRSRGCRVYAMSRRPGGDESIPHIAADVTDEAAVKAAVDEIVKNEGKLDLLVCCAGMGISGAIEFTAIEDAKRQLDVNFFGVVNAVKAALPHMRARRGGTIVAVSSLAAPVPIPFQAFYTASKAAINGYICALANEVRPFGIRVTAAQPGDIRTGFTAARKKSEAGDDAYGGRIARGVAKMEHDEENGMSAEKAGGIIAKIALKKRVKPLYAVGGSAKFLYLLAKLVPVSFLNRVVYGMYAK
ncbi:MAG: SDR family oxidoreductase [Clostridia bacterium]|nr:SDR family oxidoreductase [Clostridia bacterium]